MKCYWTVNSSYWPLLRVSQYEVNTSWPPQQKSIVLQYWKPKINSFSYAEKKIMAYVHQLLDQPSQWQTSQQAGPCSVPKFTNTSITVKHLLIKNKNINQSKSSLLIWHYVSYLFLLHMLYNAPYYFAKKQLIFELLVPSLGRYVPMQQTEYVLWTVGGEGKTNDVFKFSHHF